MPDDSKEPLVVVYTCWADRVEDGTEYLADEQSPKSIHNTDGLRLCLSPLKSKE